MWTSIMMRPLYPNTDRGLSPGVSRLTSMSTQRTSSSVRTPINPWPWSLSVGYHQAELIEEAMRQLVGAEP